MSVLRKKWDLLNESAAGTMRDKLLANRNLNSAEEIEEFLSLDEENGLHDPYLMKDMDKAVERLSKALVEQEKIIVFGDYDVDGITGAAILVHTLQSLGAQVSYRIPHRVEDGYGLNMKFIDEFLKIGVDLIVTVDCGISCKDEVAKAVDGGIDVIVTDHHTVPDEPPNKALAIVHPLQSDCLYPFKGLTGAAVAFKVCQALVGRELLEDEAEKMVEDLMDLTSLGTVADCGPLTGENRYIVKKGLQVLRRTRWEGLRSLMNVSGLEEVEELDTGSIGFRIAPRINASGRISSPLYALQLLLQEEDSKKAMPLAKKLEEINKERQQMLEKALMEAEANVDFEDEKIIMGWSKDWHVGILGLIAGRMCNEHGLPAIMMQDKGERLVGSARSNEYFNVFDGLKECEEFLSHYGGHDQAAGFDLKKENLEKFVAGMREYAKKQLEGKDMRPTLKLECKLEGNEINWDSMGFLRELGPFGIGNEQPSFLLSQVKVDRVKRVGKEGKHLSFSVKMGGGDFKAIAFRMGEFADYVMEKGVLDIACQLQKNVWNGRESIQLMVLDLR